MPRFWPKRQPVQNVNDDSDLTGRHFGQSRVRDHFLLFNRHIENNISSLQGFELKIIS